MAARREGAAMMAAGVAACAGLVLAVLVVWTDSAAPHALYQRSPYDATGLTVGQRVSMAQAKVARDLAALRQTEAEVWLHVICIHGIACTSVFGLCCA